MDASRSAKTPAQIVVDLFPRWRATPELLRLVDRMFDGCDEREVLDVVAQYRLTHAGHDVDLAVLRRLASDREHAKRIACGPVVHTSLGPMPARAAPPPIAPPHSESYTPRPEASSRTPESRRFLLADPVSAEIYVRRNMDHPSPRVREFVQHLCTLHGLDIEGGGHVAR